MSVPKLKPLSCAIQVALSIIAVHFSTAIMADDDVWDDGKVETIEVVGQQEQKYRVLTTTTATKTNTLLRNVPQAITVITEELISDQAMQNMADVVRYVPGVQMAQGEGHRDAPVLRGNTSTADFFVNGVRDDVQYFRDLYNVQRVEILKGPSGMIFGRGGAGGLINRVTKQANWVERPEITLSLDSFDRYRFTGDVNQVLDDQLALRVTGMYEDSQSYRDFSELKRKAINPTMTFRATDRTSIAFSFEHFEDERVTDRGIPSFNGKPLSVDAKTFFGSVKDSHTNAELDAFSTTINHEFENGLQLTNQTRYAVYDKFYANVLPGAYNDDTKRVTVTGYSNQTDRKNWMNQTDLTKEVSFAGMNHTLLAGIELNRQLTDNQRNTAYFPLMGANATSAYVTLVETVYNGSVEFRQSATDALNHSEAKTAALYLQDQVELNDQWQAVIGVRFDRFEADLTNYRNNTTLQSNDSLWSPRAGLIYKPKDEMSFYVSYSAAFVPRAGEQLASLNANNAALKPEKFSNKEFGFKWDLNDVVSINTAIYQLQRSNVATTDPANPSLSILVDGQQVEGVEFEVNGTITDRWQVMAGFAYQDSEVQTPGSNDGHHLGQVPEQTFSLWNRYTLNEQWSAALGVVSQSKSYVVIDNTVVLPGFTRVDAGVFFAPVKDLRIQLNIENLLDKAYYASAHNNNNITPASPRAARLGLSYKF
ncbi:MAG: TonB-dependent siderophore receptor [Gammaproteobacteria bacterium]|nr:TonB-dependent siderophore receptor [Gammaproteobacteria bacterium]MBU2280539.1 TonB-dependent siderophore receptor [Gammaproteobacteria bacterium]